MPQRRATTKGFTRTSALLTERIRAASESRGFAQSRLLTHWTEVAGEAIAAISRPVEISYGRGIGATLVLLTTGSHAPVLEMEKEKLRARVNAVYGYNAISRIRITQTAPTGFAEGQVAFEHRRADAGPRPPDPVIERKALDAVGPIEDEGLRRALSQLGQNILTRTNR